MIAGWAARLALCVALVPACSVTLDDQAGFSQTDAAIDALPTDSAPTDADEEPIDADMIGIDAPRCSARQVILVFDGITLTQGPANALQRTAPWVGETGGNTTRNIPAYRNADANREAVIGGIVTEVRARLAQFPIQVNRATEGTLPTTGEAIMVVVGGSVADSGSAYSIARNVIDCGDAAPNDVAWIAENANLDEIDDLAVGAIAYGLGLGGTTAPDNCLCSWRTTCTPAAGNCTLATAINAANDVCGQTPNPQNQVAAFEAAFCQ